MIPATFNGKPVAGIGENAFRDCTSLASVTIPSSVTTIGDGAFLCCVNLLSIDISQFTVTKTPEGWGQLRTFKDVDDKGIILINNSSQKSN
ncbi:MAG: leucine-rich repeat domain-containing protein [Mycoplasmoidaceae bacterium]|nr:leucine-rich repeat domain-containing protein [Mycoplasmoidaceae bacterium]